MNLFLEEIKKNSNFQIAVGLVTIYREGRVYRIKKGDSQIYSSANAEEAWNYFVDQTKFDKPMMDITRMEDDWGKKIDSALVKCDIDATRKLLLAMYKELSLCEANDCMTDRRQCHALAVRFHEKFDTYIRTRE